jgi:S1-C subfamily serine protease
MIYVLSFLACMELCLASCSKISLPRRSEFVSEYIRNNTHRAQHHIVNCDWFLLKVPEGNGSGFIWDAEGHIVTNYHVIGSSLARNPSPGKLVARVTLLGADGYQKNFEATLVGADRTKDLAVLKV